MLTPEQRRAYAYIRAYWERHGCVPTYRDLAAGLGLQGFGGCHRMVARMIERGVLRRVRHGYAMGVIEVPGEVFVFNDKTKALEPYQRSRDEQQSQR